MNPKYTTGASGLGGSLGGADQSSLSEGFSNVTDEKPLPFEFERAEDDSGNTSTGNQWEFRRTGACGRPRGNER